MRHHRQQQQQGCQTTPTGCQSLQLLGCYGAKVFRAFSTVVKHCHCPILLTKEKFFLSRECGIVTTL